MVKTHFKYSLFFDCHTLTSVPDFAAEFSARKYIAQIKSLGVDYLTCHARCNQGNAYYNTKYGLRHPALHFDLIRELGEEAHRNGITFTVYLNALLSEAEQFAHPEWNNVPLRPDKRSQKSPFYQQLCYNSPGYGDHLEKMALELASDYPIDGLFFDCMMPVDCVCPVCVGKMRAEGTDPMDEKQVRAFGDRSAHHLAVRLHDAILKVKPDCLLFFNGRPFEQIADYESHFEAECLPTGGWGYECLPVMAHYMPAMAKGKQILNMTGRFNSWGDFGGLRTPEGMEYDMFYGIAHGMRPDIADHMHPRYAWPQPVADVVKEVYDRVRQYDEWSFEAVKKTEIAVVSFLRPEETFPFSTPLQSAVRMLTELKIQFDVVTTYVDWEPYKLLIFPDNVRFDAEIAERVRRHIARGGKVLATGQSGLTPGQDGFALPDLWPAKYVAPYPFNQMFYQPRGKYAAGLPDMPLSLYCEGVKTVPADGVTAEMCLVEPYQNKGWDGLRVNYYVAPRRLTEVPFLLEKGNIVYLSAAIFEGYAAKAPKQHKDLMKNILDRLYPEPSLKVSGMPSFARAFLQFRDNLTLVHLMSYCPEHRCAATAIEDRPVVLDAKIEVRLDGQNFKRVFQAPGEDSLPMTVSGNYCQVVLPKFAGYTLLVFEK